MFGLYLIAFLAPLLVFGPFAYFIHTMERNGKFILGPNKRAMSVFVFAPLAISYGLIFLIAAIDFIAFIQAQ